MITVICATNRAENHTSIVAKLYAELLKNKNQDVQYFSLEELPEDCAFNNDVFGKKNKIFSEIVDKYIANASKFVIVAPEYNGSIPGVLKTFIDGIDPDVFEGKKVALVGIASGRSGNVRGMDHLTNILNYLEVEVLPFKVPVSRILQLIENGKIKDSETKKMLEKQADKLIKF